jgi:hypothetical protein
LRADQQPEPKNKENQVDSRSPYGQTAPVFVLVTRLVTRIVQVVTAWSPSGKKSNREENSARADVRRSYATATLEAGI